MNKSAKQIFLAFVIGAFSSAIAVAGPPAPASSSQNAPPTTTASIDTDPPFEKRMEECMAVWDKGTHMTKAQWRRSCKTTLNSLSEN